MYFLCVSQPTEIFFFFGLSNGTIKVWRKYQHYQFIEGHNADTSCLCPLPSPYDFVSGSYETVKIWNATNGTCIHTGFPVRVVCVLATGDLFCGL